MNMVLLDPNTDVFIIIEDINSRHLLKLAPPSQAKPIIFFSVLYSRSIYAIDEDVI